MATWMLIFKDSSLINYQALKAWPNQILTKRGLDVISGINIKRKLSECVVDDIRNHKQHNQMLNSWCSKAVTKLAGHAKIGDEVGIF